MSLHHLQHQLYQNAHERALNNERIANANRCQRYLAAGLVIGAAIAFAIIGLTTSH